MSAAISFPAPEEHLMSLNDREHWRVKAERSRLWREASYYAAYHARRDGLIPIYLPPCVVTVHLPVSTNRRRDPHNFVATVKPIIDGLVDARLWRDDTPDFVTTTEPVLSVALLGQVRIELVPRLSPVPTPTQEVTP